MKNCTPLWREAHFEFVYGVFGFSWLDVVMEIFFCFLLWFLLENIFWSFGCVWCMEFFGFHGWMLRFVFLGSC